MPLIGTVGRLTRQKGIDTFLATAARISEELPNARFVIAGDGELRDELQRMVRELGLEQRVSFLGYRQDMLNVIGGLDIMLYLSRWEPFANTLLEAMAVGTPVVATDVGGNAEAIVEGESGRLVPSESADAAANAAIDLIRNEDVRTKLQENGPRRAADFSIDNMIKGHESVYQRVVER